MASGQCLEPPEGNQRGQLAAPVRGTVCSGTGMCISSWFSGDALLQPLRLELVTRPPFSAPWHREPWCAGRENAVLQDLCSFCSLGLRENLP